MTTRFYQFAGVKVAISMPEDMAYEQDCRLAPFRADEEAADWWFRLEKTDSLEPPQGTFLAESGHRLIYETPDSVIRYLDAAGGDWTKAITRAEYRGREVTMQMLRRCVPDRINSHYVLNCLGVEHLAARNNGFIFHCAFIEREGRAILFTAPSQTGKTTQAELWSRYRGARILNGDRAVVRVEGDRILAESLPFSGSSVYCSQGSVPVEAIVYLAQATETTIRKLRGYEAYSRIWEGVSVDTWDREDMMAVSGAVEKVVNQIPVYYMPCTPDAAAVDVLDETLRKQVRE